jgi:nucleotide-binding universal stress UspA family protein
VLVVEARSVAIGLHELAAGRDADLLVIGASGEYERAFAGGDTRPVLEDAPCAVAVAPADYSTRPPAWQEIGVAYDGTPGSEQALAVARNLARERAAKLSAFTAVPVPLRVHDAWNAQRELDEEAEIARRRIAELGDVEARAGAA